AVPVEAARLDVHDRFEPIDAPAVGALDRLRPGLAALQRVEHFERRLAPSAAGVLAEVAAAGGTLRVRRVLARHVLEAGAAADPGDQIARLVFGGHPDIAHMVAAHSRQARAIVAVFPAQGGVVDDGPRLASRPN